MPAQMNASPATAPCKLLVMGVSGCGKSTLAAALAQSLGGRLIEGDEYHLATSVDKMRRGIPLEDADRLPWLDILGEHLATASGPAVLTCSALKQSYRDRLRARVPGLRIIFVDIDLAEATRRLNARKNHFFNPKLVTSQFQALEPPLGEQHVLRVPALLALPQQMATIAQWLQPSAPTGKAVVSPLPIE